MVSSAPILIVSVSTKVFPASREPAGISSLGKIVFKCWGGTLAGDPAAFVQLNERSDVSTGHDENTAAPVISMSWLRYVLKGAVGMNCTAGDGLPFLTVYKSVS